MFLIVLSCFTALSPILEYEGFKKWIRYIGLLSSIPLVLASFMFLFGNRDFQMLETISNIGFGLMVVTSFSWACNVYINFEKFRYQLEKN